jgi:hypothetical protein
MNAARLHIGLLALVILAPMSTARAACQGGSPMICKAPLMESFSFDVNIFRIAINASNIAGNPDFTKILVDLAPGSIVLSVALSQISLLRSTPTGKITNHFLNIQRWRRVSLRPS